MAMWFLIKGPRKSYKTTKLIHCANSAQGIYLTIYFITMSTRQKHKIRSFVHDNTIVLSIGEWVTHGHIFVVNSLICIDDAHQWPLFLLIRIMEETTDVNLYTILLTEDGTLPF